MYRYYPDELFHYGILGMKWGVRRYQNEDGTRTALGKMRERKSDSDKKKSAAKKAKTAAKVAGTAAGLSIVGRALGENSKGEINKVAEATKNESRLSKRKQEAERRKIYREEASRMSDKEIRDRVNRLNLEKQYVDLSNSKATDGSWSYYDTVDYGMEKINDYLTYGMAIAALLGGTAKHISKVRKFV